MKKKGFVHIYTGEGKGKTTAAIGLTVRFAGAGGEVLFTQFLKKDTSGELAILGQLEPVKLFLCRKSFGFTFQMTAGQKQEAAEYYSAHLSKVLAEARLACQAASLRPQYAEGNGGNSHSLGVLLVLDEILAAYNQGMVDRQELLAFLEQKPDNLEVVLTGRDPAPELLAHADYVTIMQMEKHPYAQGVAARRGIEW